MNFVESKALPITIPPISPLTSSEAGIFHSRRKDAGYTIDVFHLRWLYGTDYMVGYALQAWEEHSAVIHSICRFYQGFYQGFIVSDTTIPSLHRLIRCIENLAGSQNLLRIGLYPDSLVLIT